MLKLSTQTTFDATDVTAALAECDAILRSDSTHPTADKYAALFDDLRKQTEGPLSPTDRQKLDRALEDVRWAWWNEKCRESNGLATMRKLMVHSSQLHTAA